MKINLCIDASYLLYKNVHILNKNRLLKDLLDVMLNDFNKITKTFPYDNIYVAIDSKNNYWRKDIYTEYKGKRKKDKTIDWEFVYDVYEIFKNQIRGKKNIKYLFFPGLEGDDFIAHAVLESNKNGYSCLILASDGDLNQLLKYDLNDKYLNIQWNYKFSDERVFLPENYQLVLNELETKANHDIFEFDESVDFVKHVQMLINRTKIKIVKPEEFTFRKLIIGDSGDNIPGCVKCKDGKINTNGRGIGLDGSKTVYDLYKEIYPKKIDIDSDEFINNLTDVIIYYKKIKDATAKDIIRKNLIFNRIMMILDKKYMPIHVYNNMSNHFEQINNREIIYEEIIVEKIVVEKIEKIPDNFNKEYSDESFNPDDFWDL